MMLLKNTALLLVAAVLVLDIIPATYGQEEEETTGNRLVRQRQLAANRRNKLFEAQQQQQQEKVSAVAGAAAGSPATRRRLVSKTRVGGRTTTAAAATPTTEAPTTAPPTEAPIPVTEEQQRFTDFSSFVDANIEDEDPEVEDEEIQFRPRPTAAPVPVVTRTTTKAPKVTATRRPASKIQIIALEEEVEEEDPQPLPVQRQRPVAGPVRSRVQSEPVSGKVIDSVPRDSNAPALVKPVGSSSRSRTTEKPEIVETVRRYNFESDDGSFTFGYENADGSFKEETRRPDCIVVGKYGYIDPDGIKREFTYQTGNQCDPNAHTRTEDSSLEIDDDDEEEAPVRRPNVPSRRPVNTPRTPVAVATTRRPNIPVQAVRQQVQLEVEDESAEIAQVLNTPTRINRPQTTTVTERARPAAPRPVARPVTNTEFSLEGELDRLTGVQPQRQQRPVFTDDDDEEAFVPRRPVQPVQQQQPTRPVFQPIQNNQAQPFRQLIQPGSDLGNNPIRSFTSELVFDPRTNQFTSAFQQRIPETNEEINISGNLGGFVFNPQTTTTPSPVLRNEFIPQFQQQQQQQQPNFFAVDDQERNRQIQESRRQQEETERIQQEAARIAQENAVRRTQPAAQFPAGVSSFQQQPQQQTFFGVPPQQQQARAPVTFAQRPTFATGQIDSFLSSLG